MKDTLAFVLWRPELSLAPLIAGLMFTGLVDRWVRVHWYARIGVALGMVIVLAAFLVGVYGVADALADEINIDGLHSRSFFVAVVVSSLLFTVGTSLARLCFPVSRRAQAMSYTISAGLLSAAGLAAVFVLVWVPHLLPPPKSLEMEINIVAAVVAMSAAMATFLVGKVLHPRLFHA